MKRVHEGLNGYIKSLKGAGEVGVPNVQPRLPLGPDAPIPGGLRPIPTSSQAPKKTNATLVYARTAVNTNREDEFGRVRATDVGGVAMAIREGDLVFTLRTAPATRAPLGQNVKTFSLNRVNEILQQEEGLVSAAERQQRTHDKWCPDGVCHNLDGEDPYNEFKDFAINNVALQGFTRFSTLALPPNARISNADRVLVGLVMQNNGVYQFRLFTSYQITMGKLPFDMDKLTKAWTVGRVVDGKQSKNMITINVSIDPVAPEPMEQPYKLVPDPEAAGKMIKEFVNVYTVQEQLERMWLDGTSAARLAQIESQAAIRSRGGIEQAKGTESVRGFQEFVQYAARPAGSTTVSDVPVQA